MSMSSFDVDDNDDDLRNTEALLAFVVIVYIVCILSVYLCMCAYTIESMANGKLPISFCHVEIVSFWSANPSNDNNLRPSTTSQQ